MHGVHESVLVLHGQLPGLVMGAQINFLLMADTGGLPITRVPVPPAPSVLKNQKTFAARLLHHGEGEVRPGEGL